jgi:hypothetical protein
MTQTSHVPVTESVVKEAMNEYFFRPSCPSGLQLRVSFGLLNNLPPFLSVLYLFRR